LIRLALPIPPSLNDAYVNRRSGKGRGRIPAKAHAEWKKTAGWATRAAKPRPQPIRGEYASILWLPRKMRGDITNRMKLIEDLLVDLGLTPDDRHCIDARQRRCNSLPEGTCIVEAFPAVISDEPRPV
jgi:hypothetical protein